MRDIAEELGRSVSTISDELKRNRTRGRYDAKKADHKAYVRRWRSKYQGMKIVGHEKLQDLIEKELYDDQSPEMIAGFLKHQQKRLPQISKNAIYRYVQSVYGRWIEYHRNKLKQQRRRKGRRTKPWKNRVFIDKRPRNINDRRHVGHAEGDFVVSGKSGTGILLVVVDRKIRVTFLEQILKPSCEAVTLACRQIKKRYPEWKSMTTDNDILFQHHQELEKILGIKIYFCFPGHMWEKPGVENANRYIRRYVRKSSDISRYSKRFFQNLENKMNRRIMKVLRYLRPAEMLTEYRERKKRRSALIQLQE